VSPDASADRRSRGPQASEVGLDAELAFLRRPGSYPEATTAVQAVETHMSWVFLTDRFAYKLKKRVRIDHVDCARIDARKALVEEEVRLNRRLAADVYLGVVSLGLDADAAMRLENGAQPLDWLVKMRRLPADRALDAMIESGRAGPEQARALARRLAAFYLESPAAITSATRYRRMLRVSLLRTSRRLLKPRRGFDRRTLLDLERDQCAWMDRHSALLAGRVAAAMVVDGHGDLRPEHVYMMPEPVIIDCLEFSRSLRILDRVDELGFFALECERHGAPELAHPLFEAYTLASGDAFDPRLAHFHQSLRASIRAFLAIRHLEEPRYRESRKWPERAARYLELARSHIDAAQRTGAGAAAGQARRAR
jgi:aminoglycoside phosphotransferase family enzyme